MMVGPRIHPLGIYIYRRNHSFWEKDILKIFCGVASGISPLSNTAPMLKYLFTEKTSSGLPRCQTSHKRDTARDPNGVVYCHPYMPMYTSPNTQYDFPPPAQTPSVPCTNNTKKSEFETPSFDRATQHRSTIQELRQVQSAS
jgi:hypothetical protein